MMTMNDFTGIGLFFAYFAVAAALAVLVKVIFKVPFELFRKILHMIITLSIFPLMKLFSTWYMAVLAAFLLALVMYPVLKLIENSAVYQWIAPERENGEFKNSLIIVQLSIAALISIFWGLLGNEWRFVAVVAVMAWGFGDAAAALVGKAFGRRRIPHPRLDGKKTFEGTAAMYITAGLAIFFTLVFYAGQPWHMSLAVAALAAPVSAAVELFSRRGLDTITVPLTTAFAVYPLILFLTILGM